MGNRLRYRIDLPKSLEDFPFPPMLIQPLVENAIKHGLESRVEGGEILIRGEEKDGIVRLEVVDTGIGIPEKDLPRLFTEFYRASNARAGDIDGSGVGLAGAKTLVERFGGELALRTRENEGSTFTVRLPTHT